MILVCVVYGGLPVAKDIFSLGNLGALRFDSKGFSGVFAWLSERISPKNK
jgi:hypothetical protein